jgi:dihydroneopterin aldolase
MDAVRAALIDAKCKMIERAAQLAIDTTFAQDERILAVTVTLRKPHALNQAIAGIRIHRQR